MAEGGLVRCDCCPEAYASYTCTSEQIDPTLCGHSEYTDGAIVASTPPKKYRLETQTYTGQSYTRWKCCQVDFTQPYERQLSWIDASTANYVSTIEYNASTCVASTNSTNGTMTRTSYPACDGVPSGTTTNRIYNNVCGGFSGTTTDVVTSTVLKNQSCSDSGNFNSSDPDECDGLQEFLLTGSGTTALTSEDTDADAIARETPAAGTSCSSLWETRSTGFTFTDRTSEYTITAENLINGNSYEVTPLIRRRTAVIGSYGAWEDVTVAPETFTATSDTEVFPPESLTHTQGYEYEITGVEIVQL